MERIPPPHFNVRDGGVNSIGEDAAYDDEMCTMTYTSMMTTPTQPLRLQHFATRHLAWLSEAPPLTTRSEPVTTALDQRALATLTRWDRAPESGPAFLTKTPPRKLGLYFEQLYRCLLTDLLGWELIAHNLPLRHEGRTLGELDLLVRHPDTRQAEHHELAVKFYLGVPGTADRAPGWYGPNANDRLDLKIHRLETHQLPLSEHPIAKAALSALGVTHSLKRRLIMPGYLFYPGAATEQHLNRHSVTRTPLPDSGAPPTHLRGQWHFHSAAKNHPGIATWAPLQKPHWLGPWSQPQAPDWTITEQALTRVCSQGFAQLFAQLHYNSERALWEEESRHFVVPDSWPATFNRSH